jgi:protein ImuB
MKRFLSVYLPRWPIERRHGPITRSPDTAGPPLPDGPLVLSINAQNGQRVAATNAAAGRLGFYPGMPIADARAIYPALKVEPADPDGDAAALKKLVLWHQRYSPFTRDEAPDGIALDITGCAHLFGGEASLLEDISIRLQKFGLTARLAIAPTLSAASALARYGAGENIIAARESLHNQLAPLPVAALQLEDATIRALMKLGLKRIGDLFGKPRAPLAARFGPLLIRRLDQALGKEDETFSALTPPPSYRALQRFAEPIVTLAAVEHAVGHLASDLAAMLEKAGKGARRLELALHRVDGWHETLEVRVSAPARDAGHLARLLCERLDRVEDHAGFGFEVMTLAAFDAEDVAPHQQGLENESAAAPEALSRLVDRFINRFGARNVLRAAPRESYIPERAVRSVSALRAHGRHDWERFLRRLEGETPCARPLLLFAEPEPVNALALAPDSPPMRFEWRRVSHRIVRADGPERIAPEWWLPTSDNESRQTRDYYRVEDEEGRRFWLYRDGLYEREDDAPRWFIHGLFA